MSEAPAEYIRLECLKLGCEIAKRNLSTDPSAAVDAAKAFEAYVTGENRKAPRKRATSKTGQA